MEQRPLRLGDVVDDYCPRERRVTNHAVVAIVEDVIRQTRCTACDAEHPYKGAREPRLRRKPAEVLAEVTGTTPAPEPPRIPAQVPEPAMTAAADESAAAASASSEDASTEVDAPEESGAGWSMHRRLIRATLPRTENDQPPPRPIPEFTMHQRQTRGSRAFRFTAYGHGNGGNGNGNVDGNVNGNTRHGNAHGNPNGNPNGNRHGKHSSRRHRGGKRPR